MGYFSPFMIGVFLVDVALAVHCIRSGRSPLWILGMAAASFFGGLLVHIGVWVAYLAFAVIPDFWGSQSTRRFTSNLRKTADPGRDYREKARAVEMTGSLDAKRALAEESIKRGLIAEAIDLYENAMQGPIGGSDPTLLKGLARARMLAGEGAVSESLFLRLKELDPAAFDADAELDFARALALQGKNDEARRQYEIVVASYRGEEARLRFGLLLEEMGQHNRAQALFQEILVSVKGAPSYYRSRQKEWAKIAQHRLKN